MNLLKSLAELWIHRLELDSTDSLGIKELETAQVYTEMSYKNNTLPKRKYKRNWGYWIKENGDMLFFFKYLSVGATA